MQVVRLPCDLKSLASVSDSSNIQNNLRDSTHVCETVEGLTIDTSNETAGVTTFVQEACQAVAVMGEHYVPPNTATDQADIQDLKAFLARPVTVARGTFTAGTTGRLSSHQFDSALFATLLPAHLRRLTGAFGIRMKMIYTLQTASTPFNQGIFALAFQYGATSNSSPLPTNNWDRGTLSCSVTNLPHVRLDLSNTTMIQLHVPYIYHGDFLPIGDPDLANNLWDYGRLSLTTVAPARLGTGVNAATYSILLHFEDVEIVGAVPSVQTTVTLQSGRKKSNPMVEEFENDAYPFSSAVHASSRAVSWVAKGVPSLSSIAGPAAWFLGKAAGLVRYFGYSRPPVMDPPMRVLELGNALDCNVDEPSAAATVGPFAGNSLSISPAFAFNDVDEMSLNYVLSQWSQIRSFQLTTSNGPNSLVYVAPICLDTFWFRSTLTGGAPYCQIAWPRFTSAGNTWNSAFPSNLLFFGSMFRYWRGDLEFRFSFSKTKMHSGRVMVSHVPCVAQSSLLGLPAPGTTSGFVNNDGYSAIFDLKDENVFTFTVPYMNSVPYTKYEQAIGSLVMHVLDTINGPSNVSTAVDVVVEVRAKPNFELARLMQPRYVGNVSATVLQSGVKSSSRPDTPAQMCIGEVVSSIKQMIMVPKCTSIAGTAGTILQTFVMPWYHYNVGNPLTPGPAQLAREAFSMPGLIAKCYTYVRGGTEVHLYASAPMLTFAGNGSSINFPLTTGGINPGASSDPRVMNSAPYAHFRFPGYAPWARILSGAWDYVTWASNALTFAYASTTDSVDTIPKIAVIPSTTGTFYMSRAAADDAMAGLFIGPIPLMLPLAPAGTVWDPDSLVQLQSGKRMGTAIPPSERAPLPSPFVVHVEEVRSPPDPAPPGLLTRTLRRVPSGRFQSGSNGVEPSLVAGKLTTILQDSPAVVNSILNLVEDLKR